MLGFGNSRKKYNGAVDQKLNNAYQILTRGNPLFPGALAYLELIDNAWNSKMTEDEGALYIAMLYYCGLIKGGFNADASSLLSRIESVVDYCLPRNLISQARWAVFKQEIDKANHATEIKRLPNEQEQNFFDDFGIKIEELPHYMEVTIHFKRLTASNKLSKEAQTALLYRIVAFLLITYIRDERHRTREKVNPDLLSLAVLIVDTSIEWSEYSEDYEQLESISADFNDSIEHMLYQLGVRREGT